MSVICQKKYSLTVSILDITEYWTLEASTAGFQPPSVPCFFGVIHNTALSDTSVLHPPPVTGSGVIGQGVIFTNPMDTGSATSMPVSGTPGVSISMWFKRTSTTGHVSQSEVIFSGGNWEMDFIVYGDRAVELVASTVVSGTFLDIVTGAQSINVWHLLVLAFEDSTKTAKAYVDNVLVGSAVSLDTFSASSSSDLSLSSNDSNTTIDEIGVWCSKVLSPSDISQMWNGGSAARPPGVP